MHAFHCSSLTPEAAAKRRSFISLFCSPNPHCVALDDSFSRLASTCNTVEGTNELGSFGLLAELLPLHAAAQ
jgi:hypothetical protein